MVIQVLRPFDLSASFSFLWCPLILMNMNLIESPFISPCPSTRLFACLSLLWPASPLTRETYAYTFRAILNNLAADAEFFLCEWNPVCKKNKIKKKNKKRKKYTACNFATHNSKCFPAHYAFTSVEIIGKIICNWHFGEHFFLFLSGFPVSY